MARAAKDAKTKVDGRQQRSARTRRAVAAAMLDLLERGVLRPTIKDVSRQAGVSERAVFRHFQDTESLHLAAGDLQIRRVARKIPPPPDSDAALSGRIERFVARWAGINEHRSPVRRFANTLEPFSEEISRRHEWLRKLRKAEIRRTFKSELDGLDRKRRADVVQILDLALAWTSWEHLRRHGGASVARARRITAKLIANELA